MWEQSPPAAFFVKGDMADTVETEKKFKWSKPALHAAVLLAADEINHEEIAAESGTSVTSLWRWRQHPEFQERVQEHEVALQAAMLRHAVAKRHKRLAVLDKLHSKALAVIEARGIEMADEAPGAETGLLVKSFKVAGNGPTSQVITEYAVDVPLMREIRAIEEQAGKELGQWEEKQTITGEVMVRRYIGVDVDAV